MKGYTVITCLLVCLALYLALFYQQGFINPLRMNEVINDTGSRITFVELIVPSAIVALLAGYLLGNIGLMMQNTFRNGLVGPELLGISSVISCINAVDLTFHLNLTIGLKLLINIFVAIIIGIIVFVSILKMRNMVEVILMGTIIAMLINGIIIWMMSIGGVNNATVILNYLLGTVADRRVSHLWIAVVAFCLYIIVTPMVINYLSLMKVGDELAQGIGADVNRLKITVLFIAIILTAFIVTIVGPISFIAVLSPHIARLITRNTGWQTFYAGCTGSFILLMSLNITHISSEFSIPTGVITSIIGIPLFIMMLVINSKKVVL